MIMGFGILLFLPAIFLVLPWQLRFDPNSRRLIDRFVILWSRMVVFPLFGVKVKNRENLPSERQACVYVANHQSFMDILSLYHLGVPFKFVSKASILKIPVIGWAMRRAKTITIERDDKRSQLATFRQCVDALKGGTSICIFPEGTRSKDGSLLDFKKGPFAMAKRAKVPIVPITILGTGRLMPSKREYQLFRSGAGVDVVVHPLVSAQEIQERPEEEISKRVKATIESALPPSLRRGETQVPSGAT